MIPFIKDSLNNYNNDDIDTIIINYNNDNNDSNNNLPFCRISPPLPVCYSI